jgi:hypothetical protein
MKKAIVLAIIGVAAGVASSYGQGVVYLDNYNTYGPNVNYGAGSDGAVGTGVNSAYTMGIYYWNAAGSFTGSTLADPSGTALPGSLGSYLLATGTGSTAQFDSGTAAGFLGQAFGSAAYGVPGSTVTGGDTWTMMIVAYEGASYNAATYRGHSAAFTIVLSSPSSPTPVKIGTAMPGFNVFAVAAVPEPTTMALGGLGLASLLLFRRKQA